MLYEFGGTQYSKTLYPGAKKENAMLVRNRLYLLTNAKYKNISKYSIILILA